MLEEELGNGRRDDVRRAPVRVAIGPLAAALVCAAGCALVQRSVTAPGFASAAENHVLARSVAEARARSLLHQLAVLEGAELVLLRDSAGTVIDVSEVDGSFTVQKLVASRFRDGWRAHATGERTAEATAAMEALPVTEVTAGVVAETAAAAATLARLRALRELAMRGGGGGEPGRYEGKATLVRVEYSFSTVVPEAPGFTKEHELCLATVTVWGVAKVKRVADLTAEEQASVLRRVAVERAQAWEWQDAVRAADAVLAQSPESTPYGLLKAVAQAALGQVQPAAATLDTVLAAAGGDESDAVRLALSQLRELVGAGAYGIVNEALIRRAEAIARAGGGPHSHDGSAAENAIISIERSAAAAPPASVEPSPSAAEPAPAEPPPPAADTASTAAPTTTPAAPPAKATKKKRGKKR
jgi:hypothetical protein